MLVSIVTVCFNSEKTIRRTIESVLNQTYTDIEYLIIDGKSRDHTLEIINEYRDCFAQHHMSIRVVSEKDNGIYDAMNKGIRLAKGDIVGIINSDDWYEPDAIQTVVESYQKYKFDYFYADINLVKEDGRVIVKHSKMDKLISSRHWNHPTCFVTKALYEEVGVFRCQGIHDDFDFFLRVRRADKKILIKNKVLANFSVGGVSNDKSIKKCRKRCHDRFVCYTNNGYSRMYLIECVAIEAAKFILS